MEQCIKIYTDQIQGSSSFAKHLFKEVDGNSGTELTVESYKEDVDAAMSKYD